MDSGLNHVLTVGTRLESVNDRVLRVARHPPETNMGKLGGALNHFGLEMLLQVN